MPSMKAVLAFGVAISTSISSAQAAAISQAYNFSAQLYFEDLSDALIDTAVDNAIMFDEITGRIVIDNTFVDRAPGFEQSYVRYAPPHIEVDQFSIPSNELAVGPLAVSTGVFEPLHRISTSSPHPPAPGIWSSMAFGFFDPTKTALEEPVVPSRIDLSDFSNSSFQISSSLWDGSTYLDGEFARWQFQSLTQVPLPLPVSLLLGSLGLLALAGRNRKV